MGIPRLMLMCSILVLGLPARAPWGRLLSNTALIVLKYENIASTGLYKEKKSAIQGVYELKIEKFTRYNFSTYQAWSVNDYTNTIKKAFPHYHVSAIGCKPIGPMDILQVEACEGERRNTGHVKSSRM
ncbi:jg24129 [Pararge aegeria aegeria]|uniref:Jg24129 protein n=1 Tax=Pararge aegeria aegeria TaxID=348720 RepID=A0A8S4RNS3_9NEOP|nr:jg24129 [Pararge aegeria aegeria]